MNTCNTNIDPHSVDAFGDPLRVQAKFHSENPIVAVLTNDFKYHGALNWVLWVRELRLNRKDLPRSAVRRRTRTSIFIFHISTSTPTGWRLTDRQFEDTFHFSKQNPNFHPCGMHVILFLCNAGHATQTCKPSEFLACVRPQKQRLWKTHEKHALLRRAPYLQSKGMTSSLTQVIQRKRASRLDSLHVYDRRIKDYEPHEKTCTATKRHLASVDRSAKSL